MKNLVAGRTGLRFVLTPLALSATLILAACGGDDGSNLAPPTISAQPAQQSVVAGGVATFYVTANGDSLTYQWQSSSDGSTTWTDISGANAASYSVDSSNPSLSGAQFRVVISSGGQSVTSSAVALTVTTAVAAPAITVDVAAVAVTAGADAVFSVTASGTSLAYQWQVSSDGTTFANVAGATAATLTLSAVALADSGKTVRVIVSNSGGTVNSASALLYVTAATATASITAQPLDTSAIAPAQATFSVMGTGSPAPTYQWQKSADAGTTWVDIAGATSAYYTTPATAVADSGSLYRVNVTNASATVASNAAKLTVSAAAVPVAITTQPVAVSVTVPGTATFTVAATGTPTPTYQWQVKDTTAGAAFVNITGGTSSSYTTPATVAADSGKQFQVVVTNGSGSVTSTPVTLTATVAATVSNLTGRAWTVGQSLETGDASVMTPASITDYLTVGIDDTGNAIRLFIKSDGTRNVLYATRGVVGAPGTAPVWSAPVAIDSAALQAGTTGTRLTVAPNGNAIVTWLSSAPCATTTSGSCAFLYSSRYNVASDNWSAPVQLTNYDTYTYAGSTYTQPNQFLNNKGDFAILLPGAVLWQAAGQTVVQTNTTLSGIGDLGMDKHGNMVLAGLLVPNFGSSSSAEIFQVVAYRGSVTAGFGAQEILAQQTGASLNYDALTVGLNGQAIVAWSSDSGDHFAADIATPTGTWRVTTLGNFGNAIISNLFVNDAGNAIYIPILTSSCDSSSFYAFSAGSWTLQNFPAGYHRECSSPYAFNRNGNMLLIDGNAHWSTYDAATNTMIRLNTSGSTSVYGPGTYSADLFNDLFALSVSGIGVLTLAAPYDSLPTAAQHAGGGRSSVINLWGLFLK